MSRSFSLTYDYLCPFARIANEAVVTALRAGADWEVTFVAFSLAQTKVAAGAPAAWDRPAGGEHTRGVLAHTWAIAVRESFPDRFVDFHTALYDARFDSARDVDDAAVLGDVAASVGLDGAALAEIVASGKPAQLLATSHRDAVDRWAVFGVPTFISGEEAVFVRLMERHRPEDLEQVLDLLDWTRLNEFKRTRVPR